MCDMGHPVSATRTIARANNHDTSHDVNVWMLIGLVAGAAVCTVGGGLRPDRRRRAMSDAAALGYRVGLGENPVTMQRRSSELDHSSPRTGIGNQIAWQRMVAVSSFR